MLLFCFFAVVVVVVVVIIVVVDFELILLRWFSIYLPVGLVTVSKLAMENMSIVQSPHHTQTWPDRG